MTDDTTTPIEGEAAPASDEQRQVLEASEVLPAETVAAIEEGERELAESEDLHTLKREAQEWDRNGQVTDEDKSRPSFILSEVETNHPTGKSIILGWDTCGECKNHIRRCECVNGPHRPRYVETWHIKNEEANQRIAEQKAERARKAVVVADPDEVALRVREVTEVRTPTGRKPRSDKGKPRGPRKKVDATPETVLEAAGDLSSAMKES